MKKTISLLLAVVASLSFHHTLFAQVTGTGTVNYIPKWNGTTTITNSQIVDDGTNVGIGIDTPEVKFQVVNAASYSSPFSLPLANHNTDEIFPGEVGAFVASVPGGNANTSIGVLSIADGATECWAVVGIASSPAGGEAHGLKIGVLGGANADNNNPDEDPQGANVGVKGSAGGEGSHNVGVHGIVETNAGAGSFNAGMNGAAVAEDGLINAGVVGEAEGAEQNIGVSGRASGESMANIGVIGESSGEGQQNAGVYGTSPVDPDGFSYAGYFEGDVTISNYLGIGVVPTYPRAWLDVAGLTVIGEDIHDGTGLVEDLMLSVDGAVAAKEVLVTLTGWADFVFKDGYQLRPLDELKKFIAKHQHLPGVPSEKEVAANGISLGKMDALLLQKIEELTLYILEQEKRIRALEK